MKPSVALSSKQEAIRRVVASHRACNPRVFGSVIRDDDVEGCALDLHVDPTPETTLLPRLFHSKLVHGGEDEAFEY